MLFFKKTKSENELSKSSQKISKGLVGIFTGKKLDEKLLEKLEDLLITSDLSLDIVSSIIQKLRKNKYNKNTALEDVKEIIAQELSLILKDCEKPLEIDYSQSPFVIMLVGINGSGKTTSIGKIAYKLYQKGKKVLIAACDTFRAGAAEQLEIWAKRSKTDFIKAENSNTDPASIAYKSFQKAKKENYDILLIDTAGRLQNNINLMEELSKIVKVLQKFDKNIPHKTILVLDATIGQNSKRQAEVFSKAVNIDGIIMNKLDGTAKGGTLVSIANEFKKPIYAIGIGEKIEDLKDFKVKEFIDELLE
jgi:fused signal recognition particle receptor